MTRRRGQLMVTPFRRLSARPTLADVDVSEAATRASAYALAIGEGQVSGAFAVRVGRIDRDAERVGEQHALVEGVWGPPPRIGRLTNVR